MTGGPQPVEETADPGHVRWLAILTAVVIFSLWVMPLFSSLWLDELGTWWVVKDGAGDTIHRALTFHGQSPLYYLIVWSARVVGGRSELVLRLPSLIAAVVSAVLIYRLALTLINREAARLTVLAFAATQTVAFEASEARPYAIATMVTIASTFALVRWLDDGRRWSRALVYALLAIAVVWMHYLFALVLVAHGVYAVIRLRRGETSVSARRLAAVGVIVTGRHRPAGDPARLAVGSTLVPVDPERGVRRGVRGGAAPPDPGRVGVLGFALRADA